MNRMHPYQKVSKEMKDARTAAAHERYTQANELRAILDLSQFSTFSTPSTTKKRVAIDGECWLEIQKLQPSNQFFLNENEFKELWSLRPEEPLILTMFGKEVVVSGRRQISYLNEYKYNALSVGVEKNLPPIVERLYNAAKSIDPLYNQVLVNWYDAEGYIGKHSDKTAPLIEDSPIMSMTYGKARRNFFFESKITKKVLAPIVLTDNVCVVMGGKCQKNWTHRVEKGVDGFVRINVTFRQFKEPLDVYSTD